MTMVMAAPATVAPAPVAEPAAPCAEGCDIDHAELTVVSDEREVPVRVSWPKAEGPFPVVVFSHGMGGSRDGYRPLVDHWVAHGFVVLQPTHADSISLMSAEDKATFGSLEAFVNSPSAARSWAQRPAEVALLLDQLDAIVAEVGLDVPLDGERVGVGGHSFGAHTTMMVGGLSVGFGPVRRSMPDPRADALVVLSPQGPGKGLDAASYAPIVTPSLVVTGTDDASPRHGRSGDWRRQAFDAFGPGDHTLLWLDGARHELGGISGVQYPGAGPGDPELLALVQDTTLAFWQLQLGGDESARGWVDAAAEHPRAEIEHKAKGE